MEDLKSMFGLTLSDVYMFRFAMEHPYLFTVIKVAQPSVIAITLALGITVLGKVLTRK
jgi:hypothetical protein